MKKKEQEPTVSQEPTVEIVNLGLGYSFDRFFCPACGAAIFESGEPFEPKCPHVEWAIFEGEFEFMNLPAAVQAQINELEETQQKLEDGDDVDMLEGGDDFDRFDELLKIWRGNTRMVFNITSEGMACGPVRETLSVGLNFVPDEDEDGDEDEDDDDESEDGEGASVKAHHSLPEGPKLFKEVRSLIREKMRQDLLIRLKMQDEFGPVDEDFWGSLEAHYDPILSRIDAFEEELERAGTQQAESGKNDHDCD